ncbi:MAG: NAD(P)/FAD-dependent oxidoreductase [Pseudomonadota bacterium]
MTSYVLFLILPLGMPRFSPATPSVQAGEPLDVVVVGAGFGGITMGKELLDAGIRNFRIYEGASEVGGTWWHNRYPGLHVDVQSSLYSLSFFPNPNWSRLWAPRKELLEYSIRLADAVGVRPFIQFNSWVSGIEFDESLGLWLVSLGDKRIPSRHVVLANGPLHVPNTPSFPGAKDYTGVSFHSARWREDVALADKRIAVIGSGASAVQIIPEIAKTAAKVDMYQRTPNWVSPQNNHQVSAFQQWIYKYVPMVYKLRRLRTYVFAELGFRSIFPLESSLRNDWEDQLKGYISETVDDKDLVKKLIPDYEYGCKRPLVTDHFYPSLNRANVSVITEGLDRFTSQGILSSSGQERTYDVIVTATGYKVASLPFPVRGKRELSLESLWKEQPQAYRTMMVNGFPNLYFLSGPNSGFIGSYIVHIESAVNYVIQVIRNAGDLSLIEPTAEAQRKYNRKLQADLQKTVWAGSCKSWYKLDNGHVIANHPHPTSRVVYERSRPRWGDFQITERASAQISDKRY